VKRPDAAVGNGPFMDRDSRDQLPMTAQVASDVTVKAVLGAPASRTRPCVKKFTPLKLVELGIGRLKVTDVVLEPIVK
jgi:hypothetical protein